MLNIHLPSGHRFIPGEQILVLAESTNGKFSHTEAPRICADPSQVPHGISDMCNLPVEQCVYPFVVNHKVAVAEIVVHQAELDIRR